jgi:hypothetical protein
VNSETDASDSGDTCLVLFGALTPTLACNGVHADYAWKVMTRVTTNARRDLDKPLIEPSEELPEGGIGIRFLRGYIAFIAVLGILGGTALVLLVFVRR